MRTTLTYEVSLTLLAAEARLMMEWLTIEPQTSNEVAQGLLDKLVAAISTAVMKDD